MEPNNTARLIMLGITIVFCLALYLIKKTILKDNVMREEQKYLDEEGKEQTETFTLVQKKNFERKRLDYINAIITWIFLTFGVAQVWELLQYSVVFGIALTLLAGLLPIAVFGGYFFGFRLQKNDFDWLLILHADTEEKVFKLYTIEYFTKNGIKYVKADTVKDAENENFQAILIDVERERFWKAHLNGMEAQPVFADDMMITDDAVMIESHKRDGAIITAELLEGKDERDIANKTSMKKIITEQEETIIALEDENNILKSQRKKGILTKTAERIAVFFTMFDDLAGLSSSERRYAESAKEGAEAMDEDDIADPFDEGGIEQ